ncbi:MAG: phenylalanine--tRNA ligase subunit alpha [Patescibacteria group bacterium]|jgi:phenylalanyl-tRNA synthetase alpha chain
MKEQLNNFQKTFSAALAALKTPEELLDFEHRFLSRKGELAKLIGQIKNLEGDARKEFGAAVNKLKVQLTQEFEEVRAQLNSTSAVAAVTDSTLPGKEIEIGHLHPLTLVRREIENLFTSMGFMVLDGPELESDYYNFESLNIPKHHPARDMQDTFYIDKKNEDGDYDLLMRTQTSNVQVRALKKYGAPLKAIIPGRAFRNEATDARHEHTFYQLEGLMVGENINFAHLKSFCEIVGKKLYGPNTKLRMRPKFYPFVEPGSNGEYTCFLCEGKGCRVCKGSGWLEILGCGLIHPDVLRAGGLDPEKYSGFAFGFGLSRLVMLKYGIDDARLLMSGDKRFLNQF